MHLSYPRARRLKLTRAVLILTQSGPLSQTILIDDAGSLAFATASNELGRVDQTSLLVSDGSMCSVFVYSTRWQ